MWLDNFPCWCFAYFSFIINFTVYTTLTRHWLCLVRPHRLYLACFALILLLGALDLVYLLLYMLPKLSYLAAHLNGLPICAIFYYFLIYWKYTQFLHTSYHLLIYIHWYHWKKKIVSAARISLQSFMLALTSCTVFSIPFFALYLYFVVVVVLKHSVLIYSVRHSQFVHRGESLLRTWAESTTTELYRN